MLRKQLAREREAWRQRQKVYDRQEHEAIAREQRERRAFAKQEQDNLKLVSQYATDTDSWKREYHRIVQSKEKHGADLEAARRLNVELKAHGIVERFGGDAETKAAAHKKIASMSKNADMEKLKKIKAATRKQFYDSRQTQLEGEAAFQNAKDKILKQSEDYAAMLRDTAITLNKILAIPAVAQASLGTIVSYRAVSSEMVTTVIPYVHTVVNNAAVAYAKDGIIGVAVSFFKDTANEVTLNLGGEFIDQRFRLYKYETDGVEIPDTMKLYDKNGYRIKKLKKGMSVYTKKKQKINPNFLEKKLLSYRFFTDTLQQDYNSSDPNKKFNAVFDMYSVPKKAWSTQEEWLKFMGKTKKLLGK